MRSEYEQRRGRCRTRRRDGPDHHSGTLAKAFGAAGGIYRWFGGRDRFHPPWQAWASFLTTASPPAVAAGASQACAIWKTAASNGNSNRTRCNSETTVAGRRSARQRSSNVHRAGSGWQPGAVQAGHGRADGPASNLRSPSTIRPCPRVMERSSLRLTPGPLHSDDDMAHLVSSLQEIWVVLQSKQQLNT